MPTSRPIALLLACLITGGVQAQGATASPPDGDETTGRMLYNAHCSACHRVEMHWRDKKIARDWPSLLHEVRRWQRNSGLAWSDEEILAVARYLNTAWYRFPSVAGKELAQRSPPRS